MNITDPIRRHARMTPYAPAMLRPNGQAISYRDLDRAIDFVAQRLQALHLQPGDYIAHYLQDLSQNILFALALARLGLVGAPSTLRSPAPRMYFCDPGAKPIEHVQQVVVDSSWWQIPGSRDAVPRVPSHPGGSAPCRVFSSSGTTGVEKHCAISHAVMTRRAQMKWLALRGSEPARTVVFVVPMTQYGFLSLLRIFMSGTTAIIAKGTEEVAFCIGRFRAGYLVISPLALSMVIDSLPADFTPLPSLKLIEVGGSLLPNRLYELARQRLCANIYTVYGAMETSGIAEADKGLISAEPTAVGFIYPGVQVQVVDESGRLVRQGEEGILRVRSPMCADSYLDDPVRSAEVFRDGWVYPGDVVTIEANGLLVLGSRASEVINSGGNKISPHVIEEILLASPQVKDCAAFGAPDSTGIPRIWAAIVADPDLDIPALRAMCNDRLGSKAPQYYLRVSQLPRNANGKVVRDELRKLAMQQFEGVFTATTLQ